MMANEGQMLSWAISFLGCLGNMAAPCVSPPGGNAPLSCGNWGVPGLSGGSSSGVCALPRGWRGTGDRQQPKLTWDGS